MKKRLLESTKGFTLVELMIVVVIMGILVAVAVPVYNGVTKNAKRNTCHTNSEALEKAATQYMVATGYEDVSTLVTEGSPITISNNTEFEAAFPATYRSGLSSPLGIFKDGCAYTFYYADGGKTIHVICNTHGDKYGKDLKGDEVKK